MRKLDLSTLSNDRDHGHFRRCLVHPDRPAEFASNVPCAPGGELFICAECAKPENGKRVFDAYVAVHGKWVRVFTQVNPNS